MANGGKKNDTEIISTTGKTKETPFFHITVEKKMFLKKQNDEEENQETEINLQADLLLFRTWIVTNPRRRRR